MVARAILGRTHILLGTACGVLSLVHTACLAEEGASAGEDADAIGTSGLGTTAGDTQFTTFTTEAGGTLESSSGTTVTGTEGTTDTGSDPVEFDESRRVQLVDPLAWTPVDAIWDPFPHHPEMPPCDPAGWYEEFNTLEVDTELCPYAQLWQQSPVLIPEGWALHVRYLHNVLVADEPANAHFALAVDGVVVEDTVIAIPSPANVMVATVPLPEGRRISPGAAIVLHLHNHGYNTWRVLEVSGVPPVGG